MSHFRQGDADPLNGHDTYQKVGLLFFAILNASIVSVRLFIGSRSLTFPRRIVQIRDLNRGAYGLVVLAEDKHTKERFALKFIERGQGSVSRYVHREIVNHMKLRHPHVISLREVFLTQRHLVLVMEYAPGGDLFSLVQSQKGLAEEDARWFFQQIVVAVDYCHKLGVCSRDIKLENTLLDSSPRPLVKLCDFGFSKDSNYHSAPTSRVGTPAYLAPEVIKAGEGAMYSGNAADIWSMGVLLYVMLCGSYPFRRREDDAKNSAAKMDALLNRIKAVDYSFPSHVNISDGAKGLVRTMLVGDPSQRATIKDIMDDPWFREGLSPEVLSFNDSLVEQSKGEPVTVEIEEEIARIVKEAEYVPGKGTYMESVDAMLTGGDGDQSVENLRLMNETV
jgi:serine/threonine-protein kinase SRK2